MSKRPSAETQLKTLRHEFNQLQRRQSETIAQASELKMKLADWRTRFIECDAERRQLVDAMCSHVKREDPLPSAEDGQRIQHALDEKARVYR